MKMQASLLSIAGVFAKIGAFTIGGGYAMIPLIEKELIRRKWLTEEELPDVIALAQSAPGVLAVNVSIFTGYKLRGVKGSIAATIGAVLPSFLIILAIAMFISNFQDNPWVIKIFKGIRPVVVSLIAVPMINMARKNNKTWWAWLITAGALIGVAVLGISPIYIYIAVDYCYGACPAMDFRPKAEGGPDIDGRTHRTVSAFRNLLSDRYFHLRRWLRHAFDDSV